MTDDMLHTDATSSPLHTPLPLITVSETTGALQISPDAANYLQSIKGSIAIVSVAGLYRTGKSYLLNLLLERPNASHRFDVGASVNGCTKGIWIWGQPLSPNNNYKHLTSNTTVLFLDTEGFGSTVRSQTHDTRIFALALLLSSLFIYNSRGVIDSNTIDDLSFVVNLTKYIHVQAHQEHSKAEKKNELVELFPDFLWVVRDFTLQLSEGGKTMSAKEYLEAALKPQPIMNEQREEQINVGDLLASFFPSRDCVTMVRPVNDESLLRDLFDQPFTSLREEFRAKVEELKLKVSQLLKPKKMMNTLLNGPMVVGLLQSYVDAFNSGSVPVVTSAWDRVLKNQLDQALQVAKKAFMSRMDAELRQKKIRGVEQHPLEEFEIETVYTQCRLIAEQNLLRRELLTSDILPPYLHTLSDYMVSFLREVYDENESFSTVCNTKLLDKLYRKSAKELVKSQQDTENLEDLLISSRNQLQAVTKQYEEQAKGPNKKLILGCFLAQHAVQALCEGAAILKGAFRKKESQCQEKIDAARQALTASESKARAAREILDQQKQSYHRALQGITERMIEERKILRDEIHSKESEVDRAEKQIERVSSIHAEELDRLRLQLEQATTERKCMENEVQESEYERQSARIATHRQLLETERNFHEEGKTLRQNQQELMQKLVEVERKLGEQEAEQMRELFQLEKEGAARVLETEEKYHEEKEALKAQTVQSIRALKAEEDAELSTLEDELFEKKARLASLQELVRTKEAVLAKKQASGMKEECMLQ